MFTHEAVNTYLIIIDCQICVNRLTRGVALFGNVPERIAL